MSKVSQQISKQCLYCLKEFLTYPSRSDRKFCSKDCFNKNRSKRKKTGKYSSYKKREFTCPICKKVFNKRKSPKIKTCSRKCGSLLAAKKRKTGYDERCKFCNISVYIPVSRYNKSTTKEFFCSQEHANLYQGRNKVEYKCETCGNTFKRSPYWAKTELRQRYCSIECRNSCPKFLQRLIDLNVKQQSSKINKLEILGYSLLDEMELLYFKQYLIANKFCVDAFFYGQNIIVQFDGDYWHGHPVRFPNPDRRQKHRMKLDLSQDAYMAKCGYKVLRFWESDIKQNPEKIKEILKVQLLNQ